MITAKEFIHQKYLTGNLNAEQCMIEFAKLHKNEALKKVAEDMISDKNLNYYPDLTHIYPDELIK